jgi:hypothetical protein
MAQKVYVDPIVYVVGEHLSTEDYQRCIEAIADWLAKTTTTKEPVLKAKQAFQECLEGRTKDGEKWWAMATSTLAARVKSKLRFDIERMQPLQKASEKQKAKKEREKQRAAERRKTKNPIADDPLYPDEIRKEARKTTYGDNPTDVLTTEELRRWQSVKDAYLRQFPEELSSMAAQTELETLVDLHFLNERYRMRLLKGQSVDPNERKSVIDQLDKLKTSLGIHPNQIAKRVKDKVDTTIGAAAQRIEMLEDWRKLRARFFVEEMLQAYQMYCTPTADGLSYHLDDLGLFGLTKCRVVECPKCKTKNYAGLTIQEVEGWLVKQGVLKEVDPTLPDPELFGADLEAWDEDDEDAEPMPEALPPPIQHDGLGDIGPATPGGGA